MKLFNLFIIFVSTAIIQSKISEINSTKSDLSQAVIGIIKDFYSLKGSYFHVIEAVDSSSKHHEYNEVITNILESVANAKLTTMLETGRNCKKAMGNHKRSSILVFIDSLESFRDFFKNLSANNFKFRQFFTIVAITSIDMFDIEEIFGWFWTASIKNVNLIMRSEAGTVSLFTFLPFSERKCGDTRPTVINKFDSNRTRWEGKLFFHMKTDMHKCPLKIGGAIKSGAPSLMERNDSTGGTELFGMEKDIWDDLAELINFQPVYEVHGEFPGLLFQNGTATGEYSFEPWCNLIC